MFADIILAAKKVALVYLRPLLALTTESFSDMHSWIQSLSSLALLVLAGLGLWSLHHARSANFVSAWRETLEHLHTAEAEAGRYFIRYLDTISPDRAVPVDEWHTHFDAMQWERIWSRQLMELRYCIDDKELKLRLKQLVASAYRAFDSASTLALHSRLPGLVPAFVAAYQDSIVAAWAQGEFMFKERVASSRRELYPCLSVVYELATRWRARPPELYPRLTWGEWRRFRWLKKDVCRAAKGHRDSLETKFKEVAQRTCATTGSA